MSYILTFESLTEKGQNYGLLLGLDDQTCLLPGKTLYEVSPWTAELFFQAGQFIGEMDEAWKDFHHPVFADRECIWYLKDVLKVRDFVSAVDNKAQQEMCYQILDEFETRVRSRLGEFDSGQIHGDYNEQNILVRRKDNSLP